MPAAPDINTLSQPLREVFQSLVGERDEAQSEHRRLEIENKLLKERIRLLLLSKYGPRAEQLSDAQLALLELEPGVTREEAAAEAAQPAREKSLRRQSAPHGRGPLPAHLPRVEEIIPVPDDFTGYPATRVGAFVTDPAPFNHPTKIAVLRVRRKQSSSQE